VNLSLSGLTTYTTPRDITFISLVTDHLGFDYKGTDVIGTRA